MNKKLASIILAFGMIFGATATPALAYERSDGRYDKNYSWYYPRNIGCWMAPSLCK